MSGLDTGNTVQVVLATLGAFLAAYLIGSIPWAYLLVRWRTGEDITEHGTGNVGAMNVRRSTGSWGWFVVAMLLDGFKGLIPAALAKMLVVGWTLPALLGPYAQSLEFRRNSVSAPGAALSPGWWGVALLPMVVAAGTVVGHNYSAWLGIVKRRYVRTGKGLATGGGALLAYDWRYFLVALAAALLMIAVTRYMMAGQVAAAFALPLFAILMRQPDWPFALLMGVVVYSAHHNRFVGLLRGREPKLYVDDGMGPRG